MGFHYEYEILYMVISLLIIGLDIYLCFFLGKKIKKHHGLTLKDTAVYPIVIAIALTLLLMGKFKFYEKTPEVLDGIGSSIKDSISIVAMSLNTDFVNSLLNYNDISSKFVMSAYIITYIVSGLALISISISLVFVSVANGGKRLWFVFKRKAITEVNYIFGYNDDCMEYVKNYYDEYLKPVENPKKTIKAKEKWRKKTIKKLSKEITNLAQIDDIKNKIDEIEAETNKYIENQRNKLKKLKNTKSERKTIKDELKEDIKDLKKNENSYKSFIETKDNCKTEQEKDEFNKKNDKFIEEITDLNNKIAEDRFNLLKNKMACKFKRAVNRKVFVVLDNSKLGKHETEKFYLNKYKCLYVEAPYGNALDMAKTINSLINKNKNRKIRFISFLDDDKANFTYIRSALDYILELKKISRISDTSDYIDLKDNVEFIAVGNIEQERFLNNMINKSRDDREEDKYNDTSKGVIDVGDGRIRIVNKYDLISLDFVKEHNFARYLTDKDLMKRGLSYSSIFNDDLTVKDNVDINLYVLGLGKVNQAVLRDVLVSNQFVQKIKENGQLKLAPKRMNVKIYDSKPKIECFELNNGIFKYNKDEYVGKTDSKGNIKYLSVPEDYVSKRCLYPNKSIYEDKFINTLFGEINDRAQGKKVVDGKVIVDKTKRKLQVNFFIVSLDSDFENSDLALKLRNNIDHIDNTYNVYFIRVRNSDYDVKYNIHGFGSTKNVLSYDNIVADNINKMAKTYSFEYDMSYKEKDDRSAASESNLNKEWRKKLPIERRSNLYAAYGIYFKLSMLYLKKGKDQSLKDYLINNYTEPSDNQGKPTDANSKFYGGLYKIDKDVKLADFLAFLEHERWNAYEFSQGALPMSKQYCERYLQEICKTIDAKNYFEVYGPVICNKDDNKENTYKVKYTKTYDELYHLAITSSEGLKEFYTLVDGLNNKYSKGYTIKNTADIISYDYQSMNIIFDDLKDKELSKTDFKDIYTSVENQYKDTKEQNNV